MFYLASGCRRGERCLYRHEPKALGSMTVCRFFLENRCTKKRCPFRHVVSIIEFLNCLSDTLKIMHKIVDLLKHLRI